MENYASFLILFNQDRRKHITIENTEKTFFKLKLSIFFINTCFNENILSPYIII